MLLKKALIFTSFDLHLICNEDDGTLLSIAPHHTDNLDFCWSLREGTNADICVHINNRKVRKIP